MLPTNANTKNLALSNGIDWKNSPHGNMAQINHLGNINISQRGLSNHKQLSEVVYFYSLQIMKARQTIIYS